MAPEIVWNGYGKARVRLVQVVRSGDRHELRDVEVAIRLEGAFEAVHAGDNRTCLPTDTMKNTVYVLAKERPVGAIEEFALRLARHFLASSAAASRVRVEAREHRWTRASVRGSAHRHTFLPAAGGEQRTAAALVDRQRADLESGLDGLRLLKTTGSAFTGFPRDRCTTLKEARDRILATKVRATWRMAGGHEAFDDVFERARAALIESFAEHDQSQSVQHTLHVMGSEVFARCPEVVEVHLSLPNEHCLLVDLSAFGHTNENEIFLPIDEPHGLIEATLRR